MVPSFADINTAGVKDSLVADLTAIKTVLTNTLNDPGFQGDAGIRVPLLNRVNPNPDPNLSPPGPPQLSDFLNADLSGGSSPVRLETLLQNNLITPLQNHGTFDPNGPNADFVNFLKDLGYLNRSLNLKFPGLNTALIDASLTSSDQSTAPITLSDTRDSNGDGVLTTRVTNSTLIDIDLTFQLDQTQTAELDLGKQALLAGLTIDPTKGEGTKVHLDGAAVFRFDFGLLWTQQIDTATAYKTNVAQPNPVVTFHAPTIDPFLKPSGGGSGLDLRANILAITPTGDQPIDVNNPLDFSLRLGFLQTHANTGNTALTVNPAVHVGFTDPNADGFIYLDGAQTHQTEIPGAQQSHSGVISAGFDVSGNFFGFSRSGHIALSGDPFSNTVQPLPKEFNQATSPTLSQFDGSLNDLLPFASITPDTVAGLLEGFGGTPQLDSTQNHNPLPDPAGGWLNNLSTAADGGQAMDFSIPFTGGTKLGDVLNFAEAFEQKVINFGNPMSGLVDKNADNQLFTKFVSAQDFASRLALASILQPGGATYDPATQALTFHVKFDYDKLPEKTSAADLGLPLDGLGDITASGKATLNNLKAYLDLVFGYDLHAPATIKLSAALGDGTEQVQQPDGSFKTVPVKKPFTPTTGVLSDTADFFIDIGQGATFKTIHVQVAPNQANQSKQYPIEGLVNDIQAAVDAANSTGIKINVAGIDPKHPDDPTDPRFDPTDPRFDPVKGRISFYADNVSVLRVRAEEGHSAVNDLGFQRDPVSREPAVNTMAGKRFFIQPQSDVLKGDAKVAVSNLNASATFGFVAVDTSGGTGGLDGHIALKFTDPGGNIFDVKGKPVGAQDGRIDLNELFTSLRTSDYLKNLITPTITGNADVKLNNVQANPNYVQPPPNSFDLNAALAGSSFDISVPDLGAVALPPPNTAIAILTPPAALADFKKIKFDNVTTAINTINTFVTGLDATPSFSQIDKALKKVVGINLEDIFTYASKLTSAVKEFTDNQPKPDPEIPDPNPAFATARTPVLQDLEQHLKEALGLPKDSDAVQILYHPGDALQIVLKLTDAVSKTLPLKLNLDGGPTLGGAANLAFEANAKATLDFGIDLKDPTKVYVYDDTGLKFQVKLAGQNLNFTAAVGPVGLFVKGGTAVIDQDGKPDTSDPATLDIGLVSAGPSHRYLATEVGSHLAAPALTGKAHIELPLYFPTTSHYLTDLDLQIGDLNAVDGTTTFSPSDLSATITNLLGQFNNILDALPLTVDGLDTLLSNLQNALNSNVFGAPIPLVGDKLKDAGQFIESIREDVVSKVRNALDNAPSMAAQVVTDALYSALGPGGVNFLRDLNHDGKITEDGDIQAEVDGGHVQWNMDLGTDAVNGHTIGVILPTGFDLGLPGLGLKATGGIEVDLPWDLPFGFGVSLSDGFYFVAPATPISIGLTVKPWHTPDTPKFSVAGSLAILSLKVEDNDTTDHPTQISGGFNVQIDAPSPDGRIPLTDLSSLVDHVSASFTATAHVDLKLTAGFGTQGVNTAFPSIDVNHFLMDWQFTSADPTAGKKDPTGWGNEPTVAFNDVELNLGTFVTQFLGPIFKKVDNIGQPVQKVLDVLTQRIPVISDLLGERTDLITIGEKTGYVPPGTDDIALFIDKFLGVVHKFTQLSSAKNDLELPLGDFSLNSHSLANPEETKDDRIALLTDGQHGNMDFAPGLKNLAGWGKDPNDPNSFNVEGLLQSINAPGQVTDVVNFINDAISFIDEGFKKKSNLGDHPHYDEFDIEFPLWQHPTDLFKVLLGQGKDINVVTARMPTLGFDYHYEQFFPIWDGLGVKLEGDVGAHVNLGFGYDLSGLIEYAKSGFRLDAMHDILYGLYVATTLNPVGGLPAAGNPIIPLADAEAGIGAGLELNLGVASAGVEGYISGELDLFAHDPNKDGRFHLNEIISDLETGYNFFSSLPVPLRVLGAPLGLFDFHGEMKAKLFAYVEALFGAWKKQFNITPEVTLFSFTASLGDAQSQPVLAEGTVQSGDSTQTNELGSGYLRVNVGPYAKNRVNGDTTDGNETVILKHVGGSPGDEEIQVTDGNNHSQTFTHVNKIVIDAGAGDDNIKFDSSGGPILADATILGGAGDDTIDLSGLAGHAIVHGGKGSDKITAGGNGPDPIGETIYGDEGADTITGGPGADTIIGGADDDSIDGGAGKDIILGDDGIVDAVSLTGGSGNDTLKGGADDDLIYGGDGNDNVEGNAGQDTVYAGNGDDTVHGGTGNDLIYGEAGRDLLYGDENNDVIYGGLDNDVIIGGLGNDAMLGDNGAVTTDANGQVVGLPTLGTGNGNDVILGDDGSVSLLGNFPTVTLGPSGTGTTGGGDDWAFGEDGSDLIYGDSGADHLYGNKDDDVVFGNADNDVVDGGTGSDGLFGDNGQVTFVSSQIALFYQQFKTTDPAVTGNDTVTGGDGDDFMFGGPGADQMTGDRGKDVVVGDMGQIDFTFSTQTGSLLQTIKTTDFQTGGQDTVSGGAENDIIFGGDLADVLSGDHDLQGNPVQSPATPGNDIIVGDQGEVDLDAGRVKRIYTTDTVEADGGADVINGNEGDDIALGGVAGDAIVGDGSDILVGDEGLLRYDVGPNEVLAGLTKPASVGDNNLATLDLIQSVPMVGGVILGGSDVISGGPGTDIEIGGVAGDTMYGDDATASAGAADGSDVMLGDNGVVFLAGGYTGTLPYQGGAVALIQTTDTDPSEATGGVDTMSGNAGSDVILGGVAGDLIYGDRAVPTPASLANDGNDVVLGDNGLLDFSSADTNLQTPKTLVLIQSFTDGHGGADTVAGGVGGDVEIGGTAGDILYGDDAGASAGAADGEDVMLGDNADISLAGTVGRLLVAGKAVDLITTTDTGEATGGADVMSGNAGSDVMLGGVNNGGTDVLYGDRAVPTAATIAADGDDVVVGDDGLLDFTFGADTDRNTLDLIRSFQDALGGADAISGNKGSDLAIGGTGGDTIYGDDTTASAAAADGSDALLGDNADIFLVAKGAAAGGDLRLVLGSAVATVRTTDTVNPALTGGADTISGNAGGDVIAGGVKGDTLYGDRATPTPTSTPLDGNDTLLGDNGALEWLSTGRLSEITGIDVAANNPALFAKFGTAVADTDLTTLDLVTTEQPTSGGRDLIYGDEGKDAVFGGTDADTIYGDDGLPANLPEGTGTAANNDLLFGDHGRLYPHYSTLPNFQARNFFATDVGAAQGGEGDRMYGEEGADILLGEQGDDRMFGGSGDDDMTGGSNVSGAADELSPAGAVAATVGGSGTNDQMDGGSGNDELAGDNAIVWRRADDLNPRFRALTAPTLYTTTGDTITANVGAAMQSDPDDVVGRDTQLVDHSKTTAAGLYGNDVMAGGADRDAMFGELGDDLMQGDGSLGTTADPGPSTKAVVTTDAGAPSTGGTLYFNVPEAATDSDDYMEGNGGNDLMYGGLGQDDMIGGSSDLFGLTSPDMRPDGSDTVFGGAGTDTSRNNIGDATVDANGVITTVATGHARDADFIMGDDADVFRAVQGGASGTNPTDPKDQYLTFVYDNYAGGLRIIPRVMKQLDYTLGGADYRGGTYTAGGAAVVNGQTDNGAADLIHGESGDDVVFGQTGSDVVFGEGQDDDIVGGYGHDWISGGTGQDGVIGDDGLLSTSRNNATVGEPLYGVAPLLATDPSTKDSNGNVLNELISTPGNIQIATINKAGDLKKTADLVPFSYDHAWNALDDEFPDTAGAQPYADDIIFGGLGNDFLHGGSGDDAISGAEALDHAYVPIYDAAGNAVGIRDLGYAAVGVPGAMNPGDVLAFNPEDTNGRHLNNRFRPGEFALYDEYDPLRKILLTNTGELSKTGTGAEFLLNFNQTEGVLQPAGTTPGNQNQSVPYPAVNDDGSDVIFGDLGNDWLVGGTGRDNMYGGWGNDLLNADDDQTTDGTKNDVPDTAPTYEDRAYGGAGRDVLIGNTGGDRLIDWVGEYNSYLVPYAPFGMASVSRTLQPHLHEFLYALSKGDGADPTRPADTGADPARNGEPNGEMGLVLQKDFAWKDQTGAPSDPQAGNIPGGKRDVLRSADFNNIQGNPQQAGVFPDSGTWEIANGVLQVAASSPNTDAASVFNVNSYLPSYYEMQATILAVKPTAGWKSNAYLIFDYFSPTDFKFAGINVSNNQIEMGHRTAAGWVVDAFKNVQLKSDQYYNLLLAVNGTNATLVVNGQSSFTYTFAPRVIDGLPYGLNQGLVGFGSNDSRGQWDNIAVQVLPPQITFQTTEDFNDGVANLFTGPQAGTWTVPVTAGSGKYVGTPAAGTDRAVSLVDLGIGRGLRTSAYLDLSTKVKTAAAAGFVFDYYGPDAFKYVTVDVAAGKVVVGHHTPRDGWVVDATVARTLAAGTEYTLGLTGKGTTISVTLNGAIALSYAFNAVVVDGGIGYLARTGVGTFDDFTLKTDDPAFQGPGNPNIVARVPGRRVGQVVTERAMVPLIKEAVRRLLSAEGLPAAALSGMRVVIADLPGQTLGQVQGSTVYIDRDAAGYGWFIDRTPGSDSEFTRLGNQGEQGKMDLLTVLMHEFGHVLGLSHEPDGFMADALGTGVRRNPAVAN